MPKKYNLIVFDFDDTLAEWKTGKLLPGVKEWFERYAGLYHIAVASNQGGVGFRLWQRGMGREVDEKYPTIPGIRAHIEGVMNELNFHGMIFMCFCYTTKHGYNAPIPDGELYNEEWDFDNRKPAPGMLHRAMRAYSVPPELTLMVGDRIEDEQAAKAAGCDYQHRDAFFAATVS